MPKHMRAGISEHSAETSAADRANEELEAVWLLTTRAGSRYYVALDREGVWWFGGRAVPNPFSRPLPPQLWRIECPEPWPPLLGASVWLRAARDLAIDDLDRVPGGGKYTSPVDIVENLWGRKETD